MLFCMGNLSLRRGQHIGICLFEPRYRMMVAKALANDGKFGIVVDSCGFRAGARGRVVSIMYQRQRPDGCYDVVVSVGPSFTVSDRMWAVQPPSAPAHSPALMHTRAKIAEAERKIQEEKDRVNAKAGVAAKGEVPAPKPLSKSATQPDAKRKPIVLAPEENAKIEATNVFALLNMDDDEDGDDAEADVKDGDGEEEAKEEP